MDFMEKLQALAYMVISTGSVKTFFGGQVTLLQLLQVGCMGLVLIVLLKSTKTVAKTIILLGCVGFLCFTYYATKPNALTDTVSVVAEHKEELETLAELSKNIKIDGDSVSIKAQDGTWISTDDIKSFILVGEDKVSINVGGQDIAIADKELIELLKLYKG